MIYLDNAATTPLDDKVFEAMLPYLKSKYGNSQSQHAAGRAAAAGLISARDKTARCFGCKPEEVYFLSGGTEAGNLAVKGACAAHGKGHIIVSAIEHPCVSESAAEMEKQGFGVTYVMPDQNGIILPEEVEKAIRPDTFFCSVMAVNNETGTIQPVEEIAKICTRYGILYYCDCVQAVGAVDFSSIASACFAISAHKIYGPKGAAALRVVNRSLLYPVISGGMQERGLRGGTVNVAGAVGLSVALENAVRGESFSRVSALSQRFINRVLGEIEGVRLNGDLSRRSPAIANFSFDGCDGVNILFNLDLKGICVSTGSACSAGAVKPSHVVAAIAGEERAKSAVRFSFGKYNTEEEVDITVDILKNAVAKIRA